MRAFNGRMDTRRYRVGRDVRVNGLSDYPRVRTIFLDDELDKEKAALARLRYRLMIGGRAKRKNRSRKTVNAWCSNILQWFIRPIGWRQDYLTSLDFAGDSDADKNGTFVVDEGWNTQLDRVEYKYELADQFARRMIQQELKDKDAAIRQQAITEVEQAAAWRRQAKALLREGTIIKRKTS